VAEYAEALGRDLDYLRAVKEAGYLERFDFQATDSSDAENAEIMAMMMTNMTYAAFSTRPNFNFLDVSIEDEGAGTAIGSSLGIADFSLDYTASCFETKSLEEEEGKGKEEEEKGVDEGVAARGESTKKRKWKKGSNRHRRTEGPSEAPPLGVQGAGGEAVRGERVDKWGNAIASSIEPTMAPTQRPFAAPTSAPSAAPTALSTRTPSSGPTALPHAQPSPAPSASEGPSSVFLIAAGALMLVGAAMALHRYATSAPLAPRASTRKRQTRGGRHHGDDDDDDDDHGGHEGDARAGGQDGGLSDGDDDDDVEMLRWSEEPRGGRRWVRELSWAT